ncbi:MAG: AraC family transcriptional regulator [Betaproteobacteria bacterium]|nr:AraC family transcriptional regulator [Betaproteobacteria bacterium]
MQSHANFNDFSAQAMDDGFDEIIQKEWAPNLVIEKHTHPFDARVQVATGLVKLELATGAQTFEAGQSFFIPRGTEHAEQYGPNGATFWVARKS